MHDYSQTERVLPQIIEDKARQHPDHVVFQFRDDQMTLAELDDRINRVANGFLALGIKHGCSVGECASICVNSIAAASMPTEQPMRGLPQVPQPEVHASLLNMSR